MVSDIMGSNLMKVGKVVVASSLVRFSNSVLLEDALRGRDFDGRTLGNLSDGLLLQFLIFQVQQYGNIDANETIQSLPAGRNFEGVYEPLLCNFISKPV